MTRPHVCHSPPHCRRPALYQWNREKVPQAVANAAQAGIRGQHGGPRSGDDPGSALRRPCVNVAVELLSSTRSGDTFPLARDIARMMKGSVAFGASWIGEQGYDSSVACGCF